MDTTSPALRIISGVVGGVVAINFVILLAWYIVKRRQSRAKNRFGNASGKNSGLPSFLSFSRRAAPPMSEASPSSAVRFIIDGQNTIDPCPPPPAHARNSLIKPSKSEERNSYHPDIEANSDGIMQTLGATDINPVKEKPRPPPLLPVSNPPVNVFLDRQRNMDSASSIKKPQKARSVLSADSASLYSVASATPETHDRLFKPLMLSPIPGSPLTSTASSEAESFTSLLPRAREITSIREELAPETYDKRSRNEKLGRRLSAVLPPTPSHISSFGSPTSPSPTSPLIWDPNLSTFHSRVNSNPSPHRPSTAPLQYRSSIHGTAVSNPIEVPPKSALRNVRSQWLE